MRGIRWLTEPAVAAMQGELIAHYGGTPGIRSQELLESALARPKHLATYEHSVTVPQLAASYGWGPLRNHPFVDGNKRVALAVVVVFLDINGWLLACSEAEQTVMVLRGAAGTLSESEWIQWIERAAEKKRERRS